MASFSHCVAAHRAQSGMDALHTHYRANPILTFSLSCSSAAEDCALTELGEAQDSGIPCTAKACWPYPQPPQSTGPPSPSLSSPSHAAPLSFSFSVYPPLYLSHCRPLFIHLSLHTSVSLLTLHQSIHLTLSLSVSIILHLSLYPSHFPYRTSFLSSFSLSPSLSYSQQLISLSTLSLHLYLPLCHHLSLFKLFKVGLRRYGCSVAPPEPHAAPHPSPRV